MRCFLVLFVAYLASVSTVASTQGLATFLSCVPKWIPLHPMGTPSHANLTSLSFRNDHAFPLAVARVQSESQVSVVVACVQKAGLRLCARSGGHSLVGKSLCNGVLIDVADIRFVKMQPGNIAHVGAGVNMGELLWGLWNANRRWVAAGVCPSVGVGGYIFGGGHGPYEGRLGMACDALVSVTIVDRFGDIVVASRETHRSLFWALCGAGGGQFGVVTSFSMRTVSSAPFDRAVVFRFLWKPESIGPLMHKWMDYDEMGGDVWFRMEMNLNSAEAGMSGYGSCYDVGSESECLDRLKKAAFFNTTGRTTKIISRVKNALDNHAFFGPEGDWGRKIAPDLRKAMLEQRDSQSGDANGRIYQSTFLKLNKTTTRPTEEFWQRYGDFCADPGRSSIPWIVCELNLFNNAIDKPQDNAFAHRGADVITHYIVGGGSTEDRNYVYNWMKNHFRPYTMGVYVNYPELELKDYARQYWAGSLPRLKGIKESYDPDLFFLNPQPIPRW